MHFSFGFVDFSADCGNNKGVFQNHILWRFFNEISFFVGAFVFRFFVLQSERKTFQTDGRKFERAKRRRPTRRPIQIVPFFGYESRKTATDIGAGSSFRSRRAGFMSAARHHFYRAERLEKNGCQKGIV